MARSNNNPLTKGASGTIADLLTFRTRRSGNVVMSAKRGASSVPATADQLAIQRRFKRGVIYAKSVLKEPTLKAYYTTLAGPDQSAYNMALKDYMRPPVIETIDVSDYHGVAGDPILILAYDDFKVATVRVSIRNAAGAIVEQGNAVLQLNGLDWVYTATVENVVLAGTFITVIAVDTPGNESTKESIL